MNELVPLDQLATEIRYYSQQAAWNIIEVGKRLIQAKKQVAHGEWAQWLEKNVKYSQWKAQQFMNIATEYSNSWTSKNLNLSQMTVMLALPEPERKDFVETKESEGNPVESMTIKTLEKEVKGWRNKAEQAEQENATLTEQYNAQAQEIAGYKDTIRRQADENYFLKNQEQLITEPHDYRANKRRIEELEKEVATYKAHEEGMTLQQKALIDEEVAKYKNTASEEIHKSMKIMDLINAVMNLPKNMELADYAESHMRQNAGAEARTKAELEKLIIDLQVIHDELDKYIHKEMGLRVIK